MNFLNGRIEEYIRNHTTPETDILEQLVRESEHSLEYTDMISGRQVGLLLNLLVRLCGCRRILEVGTFTGYSAISMADALPENGELITLEVNEHYKEISEKFFSREPYNRKIRQITGFALDTIDSLAGEFDLVFVDADKNSYPEYFQKLKPKIRSGGVLVVDNVLWSGKVLDPRERESVSIDRMNQLIQNDLDFVNLMIPVRDGLMVAVKA